MILVVFGAGASYDSLPLRPLGRTGYPEDREKWRPPLADQLFAPHLDYEEIQRQLPELHPLVSPLHHRPRNESVEAVLQRLAAEAAPKRRTQLLAVRFYLQRLIHTCEVSWNGEQNAIATNHSALLDQIDSVLPSGRDVVLVTFNYDRMIERALEARGERFSRLEEYTSGTYKLFKLHGSVDWVRPLSVPVPPNLPSGRGGIAAHICREIAELGEPGDVQISPEARGDVFGRNMAIPAIAIPTTEKSGFECPGTHVADLRPALQDVRAVLTIGWRAGERRFLELLREHLPRDVQGMCVSGEGRYSDETLRALRAAGIGGRWEAYDGGFTDLTSREDARVYLEAALR